MSYDIGQINDLVTVPVADKQKTIDTFQQRRGFPAKYRFFSQNVVCYYHDKSIAPLKTSDIIQTIRVIEEYIPKIGSTLHLTQPAIAQGKRFALYLSSTGLSPEPGDCVNGVVGAGNENIMILHPDVIRNIITDVTIIIHELGHGFFRVGGNQTWVEESLCEFLTWYFVPSYQAFYDTTLDAVFKKSWINPLSKTNNNNNDKYKVAAIWAFVAKEYGIDRLGDIANNALTSQDPNIHDFELVANYVNVRPQDMALRWALACINLRFFSDVHKPYLKNLSTGWNISSFNYTPATDSSSVDLATRTERFGFEVSQPITLTRRPQPPNIGKWILRYLVPNNNTRTYIIANVLPNPQQICRLLWVRI